MKFMKEINKPEQVYTKSRHRILFDNFLGGLAWGLGSILGATIVVGVLGAAIVFTKKIPFIGDIVTIVGQQVQNGIEEIRTNK